MGRAATLPKYFSMNFFWAPKGYANEWQHASRVSRIPYGYFDRGFTPTWRIVERTIFWGLLAAAGLYLYFRT